MSAICRDCLATFARSAVRCPSCRSPRVVAHEELDRLTIAHLDCDAFYASVEKRDRPELRDAPVIVGGAIRGVVTTACYVARLSGVRSAMPMFEARKLCPDAVIITPDFRKYRAVSHQIFDKVRALTPLVQSLSLDEAWLDLTGTERLHGASHAITLATLQNDIERDVGVTVSIGLAPNRFLAKIASDLDKPRGFAVIGSEEAVRFLASRPVSILPGVGKVFAKTLEADGYRKVGDLARAEPSELYRRYGVYGGRLANLSRGQGSRPVDPGEGRKSISAETTFEVDLSRRGDLEDQMWPLCERVARQARAGGVAGQVITLKLRRTDFQIVTRRRSLASPTQTARILFQVTCDLLSPEAKGRAYRLIGVGLSNLCAVDSSVGDLFPGAEASARRSEILTDTLRDRFGVQTVIKGRQLRSQGARPESKSPRRT